MQAGARSISAPRTVRMAQPLEAHHSAARKIVLTVDQLLVQLETGRNTSVSLQSQISQHLNALARELQLLEELLPTAAAGQGPLWRKRITQLNDQSDSQRAALSKVASRAAAQQREHDEREMLLQRRTGAAEHAIDMSDAMARESRYLSDAGAQLDAMSENAGAVLGSLNNQRGALKGVQRKVLDMATSLGLSNNVLRMIERRQFWDKLIVYGGMLLTLALIWFVFVHLRR